MRNAETKCYALRDLRCGLPVMMSGIRGFHIFTLIFSAYLEPRIAHPVANPEPMSP